MKVSRTKFVILFLVSAFAFQFLSNSLLAPEVRLFPVNGEWFPGTGSPIAWKSAAATILYPVKIVLIGPLLPFIKFLRQDPDTPPPFFLAGFAFYWIILALILHYLLNKISTQRKYKI